MINESKFFENTKDAPPNQLLLQALSYVEARDAALDLGAGKLRDTMALLADGFNSVLAVDASEVTAEAVGALSDPRLRAVTSRFEDFTFPTNQFDLITSQFALSFCEQAEFRRVFGSLVASLKKGGIFTGQIFGRRDEWADSTTPKRSYLGKTEVEELLKGLELLKFNEREEDSQTAVGLLKHWHYFEIIARKTDSSKSLQN